MGHNVEIFAVFNPKEEKVHSDVEKYHLMQRVHYFNVPRDKIEREDLSLAWQYTVPFLGKKFDIIQCHFGACGNIGVYLKQIGFKSKLVTMFHRYDIRLGIKKGGDIYKELFKFGDCFLAISDYNYENLILFGADPKKIISHPVGIDVDRFSFRRKSTIIEHPDPVIIVSVARLAKEKGLSYGIKAMAKLLKRNPRLNLEYRIIGDGALKEYLRKLAGKLNLDGIVHFLGAMRQEEVIRNMRQAHIFLLPSISEVLPVVLMEAQAVGLPVVATSVGGISQALIDGESGFIVPEKDVNALTERIEHLIRHPELWQDMGKWGRRFVEERYDIRRLNKKLVKIYKNLIKEKVKVYARNF